MTGEKLNAAPQMRIIEALGATGARKWTSGTYTDADLGGPRAAAEIRPIRAECRTSVNMGQAQAEGYAPSPD